MSETDKGLALMQGVKDIGFVEFTCGLVEGVFDTLVTSAINQMKAYSEYVNAIFKGLESFKSDLIGSSLDEKTKNSKAYMESEFGVTIAETGDTETTEDQYNAIKAALKTSENVDGLTLDTSTKKGKIVWSTLEPKIIELLGTKAEDSFKLITTLLQMGLNRVIIKEGYIKTKLTFTVDASETRERTSSSSTGDIKNTSMGGGLGGKLGGKIKKLDVALNASFNANRTRSKYSVNVVNEKSSGAVNMNAEIIGEVLINFRSDFFPAYNPSGTPA